MVLGSACSATAAHAIGLASGGLLSGPFDHARAAVGKLRRAARALAHELALDVARLEDGVGGLELELAARLELGRLAGDLGDLPAADVQELEVDDVHLALALRHLEADVERLCHLVLLRGGPYVLTGLVPGEDRGHPDCERRCA